MTTIINNPGGEGGGGGGGLIIGVIIALILIALFFVYGLPALQNKGDNGSINVDVNLPTGGGNTNDSGSTPQ